MKKNSAGGVFAAKVFFVHASNKIGEIVSLACGPERPWNLYIEEEIRREHFEAIIDHGLSCLAALSLLRNLA